MPTDGECHSWWIRGAFDGGSEQRWPEVGSYGWGDCAWIDAEALWIDHQDPADAPPPTRTESVACGCSTSPVTGFGLVGLLPLWIRRRRA